MDLGEDLAQIVATWKPFDRQTVGRQLVRSADSIAANIAEGHGRFQYGDRRQFAFYARGSLHETLTWIRKAANRGLISQQLFKELEARVNKLGRMLNGYIRSIGPPGARK